METNQINWINVNDRLPEEDGEYLVTVEVGTIRFVRTADWITQNGIGGYWTIDDKVVAYFKMPEPYNN